MNPDFDCSRFDDGIVRQCHRGYGVEGLNNVNSFLISSLEKPFHDIKK